MMGKEENKTDYQIETRCQILDRRISDIYGAVSYPIYQTATFAHRGVDEVMERLLSPEGRAVAAGMERTGGPCMTTAACRTPRGSSWRAWWRGWRAASTRWPSPAGWPR